MDKDEIPKDVVLTCIHVINQTADAEYHKEDDAYVCSNCRDKLRDEGFEKSSKNLNMIHKSHLGV